MCFFSLICCKKSWIPTLSFAIKSGWDRCLKHSKSNNRLLVSIFFESLPSRPYKWERAKTRKKQLENFCVWPKMCVWLTYETNVWIEEFKFIGFDVFIQFFNRSGKSALTNKRDKINTPPQHTHTLEGQNWSNTW